MSEYLDIFSSGQVKLLDQTGTRIVLKGKDSCYWLLAAIEHSLVAYPSLFPLPEFQHPLLVHNPSRDIVSARPENIPQTAKAAPPPPSEKISAERYKPFVEEISKIDLDERLDELRRFLGTTKWDDEKENAIKTAKKLCDAGLTWRNQTDFLKAVREECENEYPHAAPDAEKTRRTLSMNQDIKHKRSLYRRFLIDENFRSGFRAEYDPTQPSLKLDPIDNPS